MDNNVLSTALKFVRKFIENNNKSAKDLISIQKKLEKTGYGGLTPEEQTRYGKHLTTLAMGFIGDVKAVPGIGMSAAKVAEPTISQLQGNRPAHQVLIENALNKRDYFAAQQVVDKIPVTDPYRASMQNVINSLMPKVNSLSRQGFSQGVWPIGPVK